ncbi:sigma-70 family RNA polymerase sigma factor [Streptomyces sp. DSM 44917]|uniref:Sigma-70 family RNA polymerase sigma factor n=1 Tax=Streptomyces boetiae TaxID=3075541 RepID=A0ABU2LEL9_9ACTN|nr:sigma-70 family RNA polymerase sigma factor [Streptomyces sp. DSM 44917]MDT0310039.1 sigma-70 family RNA polymerase sigma factor [Streptomyces sp. DSM 44917]
MTGQRTSPIAVVCRAEYVPLLRFLAYQGATRSEAEDAVQEAFAAACAPGTWVDVASPRAWLRTVAFRAWLRRDARVPEEPRPDLLVREDADVCDWPTPESAAELRSEHAEVIGLLRELPPKQRAVMALSLDGFTTEEIGRVLDIAPEAVRQNLHRARGELKERLRLWDREEGRQRT